MRIEFAKSLSGHDKNHIYLIWKKEGRFAYLVNGTTHTMNNPKKKPSSIPIRRVALEYRIAISLRLSPRLCPTKEEVAIDKPSPTEKEIVMIFIHT